MSNAKPPPTGPRSALPGRDDSTLFSLAKLAKQGASGSEGVTHRNDDSGLIDLKALAAMASEHTERPKLDVAPFVGVGLFDVPQKAPEPLPPPPEPVLERAPKRRTLALIAAAVAAVAAVSAIAVAATHRGGDAPLPPVAAIHTATVPAAPPPEPAKTEAPAPTETKPAETAPKPATGPVQGPSRRNPRPQGSAVVKTDPPKTTPACDLMCQMQKSVANKR